MSKKILIIDGNSLSYRAYYATAFNKDNILRTSNGIPTNAVFAFYNMVNSAIKKLSPTHIFVAFDAGKRTFRHKEFEAYKGGRQETPKELIEQFSIIKEFLNRLGIKNFQLDNYEADDIIASLIARDIEKRGLEILIMSSDHDLYQLVSPNVSIFLPKKGIQNFEIIDDENFFEKNEFNPWQTIDYKAIVGDPSDNIKGVPGIGPKGAIKLLNKYGTVERIFENIEEVDKGTKSKLLAAREEVFACKKLVTLHSEIEIPYSLEEMKILETFDDSLLLFLEKYELQSVINQLSKKVLNFDEHRLKEVEAILKNEYSNYLSNISFFNLHLNSENYHIGELVGAGVFYQGKFVYFKSINDESFQEFLTSPIKKVVFDLKKTTLFLESKNLLIKNVIDDLQLMHYVINPSVENEISAIASKYGVPVISKDEYMTKTYIRKVKKDNISILLECETKAMSILYKWGLNKIFEMNLDFVYSDIEKPYQEVLCSMERRGIKVDIESLNQIKTKEEKDIKEIKIKIHEIIGEEININSPAQISSLLESKFNIHTESTNYSALTKVKDEHPFIPLLMEYRKHEKLLSTYIENIQKYLINKNEIHTIFNQTETETGRLSSKFPNMQNLAAKDDMQKVIKKVFIARPGFTFLMADYSQIELRILAHMSKIDSFIEAFKNNVDFHAMTASEIFDVPLGKVTKEQRRKVKAVNFGLMYGLSTFGLSKQLEISYFDALKIVENYYRKFPLIQEFKQNLIEKAFSAGKVETLFGRIRHIDLQNGNKSFYERVAINMPIQGTVADLIKMASIKILKELDRDKTFLILQVHDELVFEVEQSSVNAVSEIVKKIMENIIKLLVPIPVNINVSPTLFY